MNDDTERKFLDDIRQTLTEAERDLDGATLSRLRRAREAALAKESRHLWNRRIGWSMVPLTSMIVAALFVFGRNHGGPLLKTVEPSDWQIITAEESLDTYQEDLGFYEWLSEVMEEGDVLRDGNLPAGAAGAGQLTGSGAGKGADAAAGGHRIYRLI